MWLKNACGCALVLFVMLGAITTNAFGGAVDGRGNWGQSHRQVALRNSGHHAPRGPGYATFPAAGAQWSEAPHFVRVGPNGYWVTSSWGCWIEEAQDRIVDCDSANR